MMLIHKVRLMSVASKVPVVVKLSVLGQLV